jgi:isopenicillin N synthase-like dioxygenase
MSAGLPGANDRWVATPHRVLPAPAGERRERYSVPYFQHPNYDALIECLPTCLGPGQTPRYPAVYAGQWAEYRFANYEA